MIENYFNQYDNIIQPRRFTSNYYISKDNSRKKIINNNPSLSNSTIHSKKNENNNFNNIKSNK